MRRSPLHRRPISLPIMACARRCSSWPLGRLMPRGDGWLGRLPPFGRVVFLRISCRCEDLPSSPPRMNTFCRSRPYPPENRSVGARFRSPTYVLNARATSALPGNFLFLSAPHLRDSLMVLIELTSMLPKHPPANFERRGHLHEARPTEATWLLIQFRIPSRTGAPTRRGGRRSTRIDLPEKVPD